MRRAIGRGGNELVCDCEGLDEAIGRLRGPRIPSVFFLVSVIVVTF